MVVIHGSNGWGVDFTLRPHRKADIEALPLILSNPRIIENMLQLPYPYTEKDAREWVNRNIFSRTHRASNLTLALDVEGKLAGGAGFMDIERGHKAAIGYWLAQEHWDQGIITEVVRLLVEYGLAEFDLMRIEAGIFGWNGASRRVLEKNGFVLEGVMRRRLRNRFGTVGDEHMFALIRPDEKAK